jgi:hypothetical protein
LSIYPPVNGNESDEEPISVFCKPVVTQTKQRIVSIPEIQNTENIEAKRTYEKHVNDDSNKYDEWLNMSRACKSNNDLNDNIMTHLLESNANQHKVAMILEYLEDTLSRQSAAYLHKSFRFREKSIDLKF